LKILGYGEDFLTLWAITKRPNEILSQLKDKTDPENARSYIVQALVEEAD